MPAPSGLSSYMQQTVASMSVSPKLRGTVRCPSRAPNGPRLSQNEAFNGQRAAWLANWNTLRSCLEAGEIHNRLDEDGVITNVSVLAIELGEWTEERTAAGDVHLTHGSLERGGSDIRSKGIDDVLSVALIQQHQSNLLVEGPFKKSITQSPHHHKKQGQVAATPCPISIQIDP